MSRDKQIGYEHWPEARVLRRIRLGPEHVATGNTRHYEGGVPLPVPTELVIARFDSAWQRTFGESAQSHSAYYLFYLDASGKELTDMCEQSLVAALAQAKAEFGIHPDGWEVISQDD